MTGTTPGIEHVIAEATRLLAEALDFDGDMTGTVEAIDPDGDLHVSYALTGVVS